MKSSIAFAVMAAMALSACNDSAPNATSEQTDASMAMEPVEAEGVDALEIAEAEEALNALSGPERQKIDILLECEDGATERQLTLARLEKAKGDAADPAKVEACRKTG